MLDLNDFRYFVRIVERGGVTAARSERTEVSHRMCPARIRDWLPSGAPDMHSWHNIVEQLPAIIAATAKVSIRNVRSVEHSGRPRSPKFKEEFSFAGIQFNMLGDSGVREYLDTRRIKRGVVASRQSV